MNGITQLLSTRTEQVLDRGQLPVLLSHFGLRAVLGELSVPILQVRKQRPEKVNAGPEAVSGCRV